MFAITFKATRAGRLKSMLQVSSQITRAEAYGPDGERLDVALRFNGADIQAAGFELFQNQPNPFVSKTVVGFYLPEAMDATLSVYDESGRLVYQTKGDFAKGHRAFTLDRSQVHAPGMLYYTLEAGTFSATRKMIQIK
jgi:hypothetical protein